MADEPHGHRGHPSAAEIVAAGGIVERLGATVYSLTEMGFSHDEAVSFIAGAALEIGHYTLGETWNSGIEARRTIQGLLDGRACKGWATTALTIALDHVAEAAS